MDTLTLDATAASLEQEITEAREALVALCESTPGEWWPAYKLKTRARNGWSDGAMNLALNELIQSGVIDVDRDKVRLSR